MAEKAGCEIIFEVVDQNNGEDLWRAFEVAAEEEGSVIIADNTRLPSALKYFNVIEDEDNPIIFADMEIYKPVWKEEIDYVGLIYGSKAAAYQHYIACCEEWCK